MAAWERKPHRIDCGNIKKIIINIIINESV